MIPFQKVQGIGNDFVLLDAIGSDLADFQAARHAPFICDRRFGVGADGVLVLRRGTAAPFRMEIINSDGTTSEMCGNGIRCIAKAILAKGYASGPTIECETGAGIKLLTVLDSGMVRVAMGQAEILSPPDTGYAEVIEAAGASWTGTHVSTGNPHFVCFVESSAAIELGSVGPAIECHSQFPGKINAHFCEIVSRSEVIQRTWERGAGVTMGCGTGACAVAAAGVARGILDSQAIVHLPGGDLEISIEWPYEVFMAGEAELVFEGALAL